MCISSRVIVDARLQTARGRNLRLRRGGPVRRACRLDRLDRRRFEERPIVLVRGEDVRQHLAIVDALRLDESANEAGPVGGTYRSMPHELADKSEVRDDSDAPLRPIPQPPPHKRRPFA